jgi:hypothetical protein
MNNKQMRFFATMVRYFTVFAFGACLASGEAYGWDFYTITANILAVLVIIGTIVMSVMFADDDDEEYDEA